jgi:diadenosine tetraphosphatase ApaH/serine/threonine PP2A family protein phosphatase
VKIGVYSDVHSNYLALEATLAAFEALEPVDYYVCLGDVVGYGARPDECCDRVKRHAKHTVLGNHDAAVSGRMDYNYYYPAARQALDHHRALLREENLEWLRALPYTVRDGDVCFSHGSPVSPEDFDYVFTHEHAMGLLSHWHELADITLIGHSHLTKAYRLRPPGGGDPIEEISGDVLLLKKPDKYIVTVGSVGQPRDNDARSCFTILDTEARTLTYHRVDYDVYRSAEMIWDDDQLAPDFGKRLFLGV